MIETAFGIFLWIAILAVLEFFFGFVTEMALPFLGWSALYVIAVVAILFLLYKSPRIFRRLKSTCSLFLFKAASGREIGLKQKVNRIWQHQEGKTCAINAQRIVLSVFGIERNEDELWRRQQSFGLFDPREGARSISFLLKGYGIRCTEREILRPGEFSYAVYRSLSRGRLILLRVNSYLLNNPDSTFDGPIDPDCNHVIAVTRIRSKGIGNQPEVVYIDTGHPDGDQRVAPLEEIRKASNSTITETPPVPREFQLG
jgi:hypothetical protein